MKFDHHGYSSYVTSCHLILVAEIDDRLEDEDFDLIEENLGIQLQRVSALTPITVRIKMTGCFSACLLVCLFVCLFVYTEKVSSCSFG